MSPPPDVGFGDPPRLDSWAYYLANIWWQSGQMGPWCHRAQCSAASRPNTRARELKSHPWGCTSRESSFVAKRASLCRVQWPLVLKFSCKIPLTCVKRLRRDKAFHRVKKILINGCNVRPSNLPKDVVLKFKRSCARCSRFCCVFSACEADRFPTHNHHPNEHKYLYIFIFWIISHSRAARLDRIKLNNNYILPQNTMEKYFYFLHWLLQSKWNLRVKRKKKQTFVATFKFQE